MARDHIQEVERFRAAPFPLYGLPASWPGPRHLGGWEGRWSRGQPVTTALSLGHGEPLAVFGGWPPRCGHPKHALQTSRSPS